LNIGRKFKLGWAHLSTAQPSINRGTWYPDPRVPTFQPVTAPLRGEALCAGGRCSPRGLQRYPCASLGRGRPPAHFASSPFSLLTLLSPPPLCSPLSVISATPHRRLCRGSVPTSPPRQLGFICNSRRRPPRPGYQLHRSPLLHCRAHH
jgi:hypothetical protein